MSKSRARGNPAARERVVGLRMACVIGAVMGLFVQAAVAQSNVMPPVAAPNHAQTVLAQAAQAVGVRRCLAAVDQVSERMFAQTTHADIALDWDRNNPDGEALLSLSGLEYKDASAALSLTTVPSTQGGCTILVERISSAPVSCKEVVRSTLTGYKGTPLVKAVMVYVNSARPRETVTLIDSPPSCVIVRRQVDFHWGTGR
ncbi:hypothetical protein G3N57_03195 [Paraburkholderia sp. Se-20369]|nr:hypothetical protein [Paraburkholderia sp. Se-20369]